MTTPTSISDHGAIGPARGALVIVGGGEIGPEIWDRFLTLAGGADARIVIIPTAQENLSVTDDDTAKELAQHGARRIQVLHTRDPKEADTSQFVAPLREATGVWLTGGRQWRLADAYLHTRVHQELAALLERGGVIGGTSAGATIQGSFLVRGDTAGNELMIGDHVEGFGFLKAAAIDQHLLRRNRQFDLISVIGEHPELLGIGIDEGTAVVAQGNRLEVVGASYVAIFDREQWSGTENTSPNNAGSKGKFYFLSAGERFDLNDRRIAPPEIQADEKGAKKHSS
ncbi:cyanophycinase [Capsulimonas corticalis]|uniref:Cyanophycinase n=1 Tax=Capsulimonas corticalis TaxID=2219043 RepID=A0A402CV27_9BACT|nr:cyanophycinase [Capsulimonas corticalis]BDI30259.1 cyanophycinase [Capsulimonas corticalis]